MVISIAGAVTVIIITLVISKGDIMRDKEVYGNGENKRRFNK